MKRIITKWENGNDRAKGAIKENGDKIGRWEYFNNDGSFRSFETINNQGNIYGYSYYSFSLRVEKVLHEYNINI